LIAFFKKEAKGRISVFNTLLVFLHKKTIERITFAADKIRKTLKINKRTIALPDHRRALPTLNHQAIHP